MVVYGMMDVRGEMQGQRTSNDGYETTFATTELDHETKRRRQVWTYKEQWDNTNRNCHRRRRSQYTRVFERILQYRLLDGSEYQPNVGRIRCLREAGEIARSN
jgi:hypothetical protein